jgi:hypothetical protein
MKAPGGCEHLKALAVEGGILGYHADAPSGKALKGTEPQGRCCRVVLGFGSTTEFGVTRI